MGKRKIAQAKQRFAELVRDAGREPQLIFNRERLVAALIDAARYEAFQKWAETQGQPSLADVFSELRQIVNEEDYVLAVPAREDRPVTFPPEEQ